MAIAAIKATSLVDEISERAPDLISAGGSRTWSVCGRNFVVAITELAAGDRLTEHHLPDEYMLLVQDDAVVAVEHDGRAMGRATVSVPEPALVVVPAGTSTVHAAVPTTVARVFTARCEEQMRRAVNHAAGADPRAAPLPEPTETGGEGIRIHRLRDIPAEEGRLGRIFRTASQMSVTLVGNYAHHLRVPWTPRMSEWRDDEHVQVGSPSMTLIPRPSCTICFPRRRPSS
ncbi:hypothetical protein ACPEIC_34295 [Stenotrophomonas sp. NPDC087984]